MENIPTTEQVKNMNLNPTGIGGFGDNPQNRNNEGRYPRSESFTYWYSFFKSMRMDDFKLWKSATPSSLKTVASELAYRRVENAMDNLKEYQEVADRSEGKATLRIKNDDDAITAIKVEIVSGTQYRDIM